MKSFQLQIPEPCHENWNAMTPVEKGRFCASCQKTVIDFTGKSDAQIIQFFKRKTENVCAHLHADQLNRDLVVEPKRIPWLRYLFTVTIPTWLFVQCAEAQGMVRIASTTQTTDTAGKDVSEIARKLQGRMGLIGVRPSTVIQGKVMDESGAPIAFASIRTKGTSQGTMTDSAGRFRLSWSGSDRPTLIFSSVGYATVERELTADSTTVTLFRESQLMEGAVVIVRTTKRKKNKKENLPASPVRETPAMRVFPNPVASAASFQVDGKGLPSGDYALSVLGIHGNLIRQRTLRLNPKDSITEPATGLTPGTYVIRLLHKKSGKAFSEKIIVH